MGGALQKHWPEYLMEAALLGAFIISAGLFTILLYHPASPLVRSFPGELMRRSLMGLAMGLTCIGLVYSAWGRQSGAHMNPALTLTFYRLGKMAGWDAGFYVLAHFAGAAAGMGLVALVAREWVAHPAVNYAATVPGNGGRWIAFAAEAIISMLLMLVVLLVSNAPKWARYTPVFAGLCVAAFIFFEAPISGMSMNPARSFGSAFLPGLWQHLWIYFTAPLAGMLAGAALYLALRQPVICAKLHHQNSKRCIFCEYQAAKLPSPATTARSPKETCKVQPSRPTKK